MGNLTRDDVIWLRSMALKYPEGLSQGTYNYLDKLKAFTEKELADFQKTQKEPKSVVQFVPQFNLHFLEANISHLSLLGLGVGGPIIELRRNIELMNAEIEQINFYFKKSFDEAVGPDNRTIMDHNRLNHYANIALRYRKSADIADKTIIKLKKKWWQKLCVNPNPV